MHPNTLVAGCPSCSVVSPELSFRTPCLIRRHVRRRPGPLRPHVWSCAACCDSTLISRTVKSTYAPCFPIGSCRSACRMFPLPEHGWSSASRKTGASTSATCPLECAWSEAIPNIRPVGPPSLEIKVTERARSRFVEPGEQNFLHAQLDGRRDRDRNERADDSKQRPSDEYCQ